MKKYVLFLFLLPLTVIAQKTSTSATKKETAETKLVKPADGFLIIGNIKGFPDGTPVFLLNGNTGAQEATGQFVKNKFTLTGKVDVPDFKVISINSKAPYITLFLDNSLVNVTARPDSFSVDKGRGALPVALPEPRVALSHHRR